MPPTLSKQGHYALGSSANWREMALNLSLRAVFAFYFVQYLLSTDLTKDDSAMAALLLPNRVNPPIT